MQSSCAAQSIVYHAQAPEPLFEIANPQNKWFLG